MRSLKNVDNPRRRWTVGQLFAVAGVEYCAETGVDAIIVDGLCADSRVARPRSCFVAMDGVRCDGHVFVEQALNAGAALAVVQRGRRLAGSPSSVVEVSCTRTALAKLAAALYGIVDAQRDVPLRIAGVTGTNGKTTVCALLSAILKEAGHQCACLGTISNSFAGFSTPSNMTTLPPIDLCEWLSKAVVAGADTAVLEVSSHALDQRRCDGLDFSVGIFTNLTQDHLDYHGNLESYFRAKQRLFEGLDTMATAAVCADDAYSNRIAANTRANVVRYGLSEEADVRAHSIVSRLDQTEFLVQTRDGQTLVSSCLVGRHNVLNILAATAAAQAFGVGLDVIVRGIASLAKVRGRLERIESDSPYSVFVDYAHTPDALCRVLELLRALAGRKLICVFGCGGDRDRAKRPLMARAVASYADVAVLTSDNPRSEDPQSIVDEVLVGFERTSACRLVVEIDRAEAIGKALEMAGAEDVVLIAGKGHEDYQILGDQRVWFDDVVVAQGKMVRTKGGMG